MLTKQEAFNALCESIQEDVKPGCVIQLTCTTTSIIACHLQKTIQNYCDMDKRKYVFGYKDKKAPKPESYVLVWHTPDCKYPRKTSGKIVNNRMLECYNPNSEGVNYSYWPNWTELVEKTY